MYSKIHPKSVPFLQQLRLKLPRSCFFPRSWMHPNLHPFPNKVHYFLPKPYGPHFFFFCHFKGNWVPFLSTVIIRKQWTPKRSLLLVYVCFLQHSPVAQCEANPALCSWPKVKLKAAESIPRVRTSRAWHMAFRVEYQQRIPHWM